MDSKSKRLSRIIFIVIILGIGTWMRFFWISKSPPSLNWDETALGYNAYSILKTGKDEYGFRLPLTFRSFDDYKPPLYPYITVPFIALFGLNELSVRLPSVLAGISIILAIYLIATHFFDQRVGIFSAFIVAIEPWSIHFSRAAFETNLGLAFLLWSIYFALKSSKNLKWLLISVAILFLAAYTYHAYRVLLIPILTAYLVLRKEALKDKKSKNLVLALTTLLTLPLIFILASGGLTRLESTSILRAVDFKKTANPLEYLYNFYVLAKNIIGRYFAYFSPANLFVRGANEPNQQIPGFAIFYTTDFIPFVLGIYYILKEKLKPKFFLYLIFLAPLPAIITWNWFLPARVLLQFLLYSILIGLGLVRLIDYLRRGKLVTNIAALLIILIITANNLGNLATTLFLYIPYSERGNWQFGFREIMANVSPIQDNYDQIVFETGHAQPHIFVLFYSKYNPEKYHNDIICPNCVEKPRKNFDFGKYKFRRIYWPDDRSLKNTLFIGSQYSLPENDIASTPNAKIISDVTDVWGDFVARIVETN